MNQLENQTEKISNLFSLVVDTSRRGARMALGGENFFVECYDSEARGETLTALLKKLFAAAEGDLQQTVSLDAVAQVYVFCGPGSFTGLRTGIAFCEGLCFSQKRKLYGISTLRALSFLAPNEIVTVLLKARPGYWYFRRPALAGIETVEKFLSTTEVLENLKQTSYTAVVCDSFAKAEKAFAEIFSNQTLRILNEADFTLERTTAMFHLGLQPSLFQEANYIQPSYAEQSR